MKPTNAANGFYFGRGSRVHEANAIRREEGARMRSAKVEIVLLVLLLAEGFIPFTRLKP